MGNTTYLCNSQNIRGSEEQEKLKLLLCTSILMTVVMKMENSFSITFQVSLKMVVLRFSLADLPTDSRELRFPSEIITKIHNSECP